MDPETLVLVGDVFDATAERLHVSYLTPIVCLGLFEALMPNAPEQAKAEAVQQVEVLGGRIGRNEFIDLVQSLRTTCASSSEEIAEAAKDETQRQRLLIGGSAAAGGNSGVGLGPGSSHLFVPSVGLNAELKEGIGERDRIIAEQKDALRAMQLQLAGLQEQQQHKDSELASPSTVAAASGTSPAGGAVPQDGRTPHGTGSTSGVSGRQSLSSQADRTPVSTGPSAWGSSRAAGGTGTGAGGKSKAPGASYPSPAYSPPVESILYLERRCHEAESQVRNLSSQLALYGNYTNRSSRVIQEARALAQESRWRDRQRHSHQQQSQTPKQQEPLGQAGMFYYCDNSLAHKHIEANGARSGPLELQPSMLVDHSSPHGGGTMRYTGNEIRAGLSAVRRRNSVSPPRSAGHPVRQLQTPPPPTVSGSGLKTPTPVSTGSRFHTATDTILPSQTLIAVTEADQILRSTPREKQSPQLTPLHWTAAAQQQHHPGPSRGAGRRMESVYHVMGLERRKTHDMVITNPTHAQGQHHIAVSYDTTLSTAPRIPNSYQ